MSAKTKYYIVAASALPEIFIKVAEAKRMMQTGEAGTVGEATRQAGISRSAFYKYKDSVLPFRDMTQGRIFTFNLFLRDEMGALSAVLAIFAGVGANILTINQNLPSGGVALVTIAARLDKAAATPDQLIVQLKDTKGVVSAELLAG